MTPAVCALLLSLSHPFHFTSSEVEWNQAERVVEVALHVNGNDLENAAARARQRRLPLSGELSEKDKRSWTAFLEKHFYLSPASRPGEQKRSEQESRPADRSSLHWVGVEEDGVMVWIYFELTPPDADPSRWSLTNTLLLENDPGHFNQIVFLFDGKRVSDRCDQRDDSVSCKPLFGESPPAEIAR